MSDYEQMVISAERYALGRMTYIVEITVNYILNDIELRKLSNGCLSVIKEDLKNNTIWGMECDKKDWDRLKNKLNEICK